MGQGRFRLFGTQRNFVPASQTNFVPELPDNSKIDQNGADLDSSVHRHNSSLPLIFRNKSFFMVLVLPVM